MNIELTEEQAKLVYEVLYCLGGDPIRSRRAISAKIMEILEQELESQDMEWSLKTDDMSGHIYFSNIYEVCPSCGNKTDVKS